MIMRGSSVYDKLYKVRPLLDKKKFCIDETIVPFQGKLIFKQYNPQKAHKYGIKIFKLCCDKGYRWNMSVYAGQEKTPDKSPTVSTKIVLNLSKKKKLLGSERICIIDNWYTSLQLARILLQ
jgi:hypothetical protein